ncbi:type I polyketide synthase [Burkholderia sp. ISTR5]|uniref:type I polyketide synthase n=1 Tax=Burkholderia sp. ISTR5 TaxID=2500161 RepID=UPI00136F0CF6|nr:type I polyketide synthase [Burkholderia sp. ISTR5]NBI44329.1 SDR family NAD(P)-dependent oxidoreductase [Burkholderia sp. ISTR5]
MLELINTYLHGFAAVPLLSACRELGILAALETGPVALTRLGGELRANPGYLRLAFRALHALDCVRSDDHETYAATERFRACLALPEGIDSLYRIDFDACLGEGAQAARLEPWFALSARGWDSEDAEWAQLLDGALTVPLLLALARRGVGRGAGGADGNDDGSDEEARLDTRVHPALHAMLRAWLEARLWLAPGDGIRLNERGRHLCERALTMGVTASYRPMLMALPELIGGDPRRVLTRDADGHETYVDRTLNVIGSGFQHGKYFNDLADLVVELFDREPIEAQPRYIVDMGCGDGALLRHLHTAIATRSARGRCLDRHPLLLVGADYNQRSLDATGRTLDGLPHLLVHADIGKPQALLDALREHGIDDPDAILHVRSFLDHDRPLDLTAEPADAAQPAADDHVYVDARGNWLPSARVARDLREHLARWAGIMGRHGLIVLEVFALPVRLTREYFSQTESFSFDFYHALSRQALVDAGTFHQALASAGLYPERESLRRYPSVTPFSRIVLQRVHPKPFAIRTLRPGDIPALLEIDARCWPEPLRLSREAIEQRHRRFPEGQFVVEYQERVVGVLYTQRIDDLDAVLTRRHADYGEAHVADGRYWQLISISAHPEFQSLALGDQLLEHALDLAALTAGVETVYGITRCLSFVSQSETMEAYIGLRDAHGHPVDPLLRFHHLHGASIERVVPGARPEDVDNGGDGVLIRYELASRFRAAGAAAVPATGGAQRDTLEVVSESIRRIMRAPDGFAADRPLRELGLDSMGLMELRLLLGAAFSIEFDPASFFSYPTAQAIAGHIDAQRRPADAAAASPAARASSTGRPEPSRRANASADAPDSSAAGVAIVGIALRFPGGIDTPQAYWRMLEEGRCVIGERPDTRWREYREELAALAPALPQIHRGGFLDAVDRFDAAFFRITPREAQALDPQQRLLLELVHEAFEQAGIDADTQAGREVGVFLGAYTHDYEALTLRQRALGEIDAWFGSGTALSTAAGRLAYCFDFRGPTMTIDTACSSSSSAIFSACRSLLDGSASLAVAASVNLMIGPSLSVAYGRASMLSPDGLCKTFDASADGYVRGEGGVVLLLKRLDDALADGDRVHAVIRSAALMQDGRTNGLTAPNGQAQVDVIRRALAQAGCGPADIDYVEAHGTGTRLGDPVEIQALHEAYCAGVERAAPLSVGSVKTNLGHTEAVSGMAGLLKVVLAMQHRVVPAHLHLKQPSPLLRLDERNIEIARQARDWPAVPGRPRRAGISSFGFSGSNTHLIVEEFVAPEAAPAQAALPLPAVISAATPAALRANLAALAAYLEASPAPLDLAALSRALTAGRTQHARRVAFSFDSHEALREQLVQARAAADTDAAPRAGLRIAFMYTGQGAQYHGMARQLAGASPVFRAHLERCAALVREHAGFDLFDLMWGEPRARIDETRYTQVALFCVEHSLALLLREAGIEASVVLGHSVGEYGAACYAGVMDEAAAIRLLSRRGELMHEGTARGAMVALLAPLAEVEALLRGFDRLAVAALNGPRNQVVAGDPQQLEALARLAGERQIPAFPLSVERAFHSPLMEPILPGFRELAERFDYAAPCATLISNLTGEVRRDALDAGYWTDHIRQPVRFEHSVRTLLAQQVDLVIEIGPKPILTRMAQAVAPAPTLQWLPALVDAGRHGLAAIFAKASEAGLAVDWRAYPHESAARLDDPPLYRFQRESYWLPELGAAARDLPRPAGSRVDPAHGANVSSDIASDAVSATDANATTNPAAGAPAARVEVRVDPALDRAPWAHVIGRHSVFPAGGYLGLAIEAALRWLGRPSGVVLRDLRFEQMLRLADDGACRLEATARPGDPSDPGEGGELARATILVRSASADANAWTTHARATAEPLAAEGGAFALAAPADTQAVAMDGASFYRRVAALGYDYAAPFRGITWLRRAGDTVGADLSAAGTPEPEGYAAAPWRLDHCLQTVLAARLEALEADGAHLLLPIGVERLAWHGPLPAEPRVACRVRADRDGVEAELRITDAQGTPCCEMAGLRFARVDRRGLAGAGGAAPAAAPAPASSGSPLHTLRWQRIDPPSIAADEAGRPWLLVGAAGASAGAFAAALGARGARVERLDPRDAHDAAGLAAFERRLVDYAAARAEPFGLVHLHADAAVDLAVVRFLAGLPAGCLHRALLVTQGAQAVADEPPDPAAAALWGLGAALQAEAPQQAVTLLDLDAGRDALLGIDTALRAADAVDAGTAVAWPDHLALRAGRCHQRRLAPATARGPLAIAGDGGYLVTGGLGGLGRCVVEFLHARGAGRIVVLGRSLPAEPPAWLAALQARRAVVELLACDLSDAAQVAGVPGALEHELPLRGVVHAAGVLDDARLVDQDAARLRRVAAPKLDGARHLLDALAGASPAARLDFVWLFSSITALHGGAGQANYAAANAALDGYAHALRARGVPATAINWGPWRDTGMLARVARPEATYARLHADPLEPAEAPRWFDALLAVDGAQFCAVHWRLDALARVPRVPALLRGLVTAASSAVAGQAGAAFGRQRLADALPSERAALARRLVAEQIALVTGIAAATIEPAAPLSLLGMDSLMSVALSEALANCLGIAASATLLFDHPTLDALAQHVLAANVPAGAAAPAAASVTAAAAAAEPAAAPLDTELSEIEGLQDDDLAALLGKEFIRE